MNHEFSISLSDVVAYAKSLPTLAKRQAVVNFLKYWGELSDSDEETKALNEAINDILSGQAISPNSVTEGRFFCYNTNHGVGRIDY